MRFLHTGLLILTVLTSLPTIASAQDVPRYSPQRPTISPYLNLTRNGRGSLPNYYSLVRPQLNQQSFDRQAAATARSQALAIQSLKSVPLTQVSGPTGTGSVYQNYSHFYPARTTRFQQR